MMIKSRLQQRLSKLMDSDNPDAFHSLREFMAHLESRNDLVRIQTEVDPKLEITEICHRTLKQNEPALLFENPARSAGIPLLGNLFGSPTRIAPVASPPSAARAPPQPSA